MPSARERKPARATMEETGDGVRAWLFLRRVEAYEGVWRAQTALSSSASVFEPGPFPIRIQTPADCVSHDGVGGYFAMEWVVTFVWNTQADSVSCSLDIGSL